MSLLSKFFYTHVYKNRAEQLSSHSIAVREIGEEALFQTEKLMAFILSDPFAVRRLYYYKIPEGFIDAVRVSKPSACRMIKDLRYLTIGEFEARHKLSVTTAVARLENVAIELGFESELSIPMVYTATSRIQRQSIHYLVRIMIQEIRGEQVAMDLLFNVDFKRLDVLFGRYTTFSSNVFDIYRVSVGNGLPSIGLPDPCPGAIEWRLIQ